MRFPHEAWFLPDAYSGRNEYVRETIVQMVINYNSFMTREILPWRWAGRFSLALSACVYFSGSRRTPILHGTRLNSTRCESYDHTAGCS